ncbi:mechanosensitive ion channel family protein [Roseivirga sp. BDSF3-8]|uniref:mechanosensitive ion channel family protein n=1 Tax=Roseivirga sp. BDSF3-8 TaxID=3241598 RepID=UPI003531ADC9
MKTRIREAFQRFGEKWADNAPEILVGIGLFIIFLLIGILLRRLVVRRLFRKVHDRLPVVFAGRLVMLIMVLIGFVSFLNAVGLAGTARGLLAGAGVTALVLGFAFKDIGENLLSGVFLAFGRPFKIGDLIQVDSFMGNVQMLNLRNTQIRTFDGRDVFLPNSMLIKNPLTNYTKDGLMRHDFLIGLDYGTDVVEAERIILDIMNEQNDIEKREHLRPFIVIEEFAASTINLRIYFWINTLDMLTSFTILKYRVMLAVMNRLIAKGIKLPSDIVEFKMYEEERRLPISVLVDNLEIPNPPNTKRGSQPPSPDQKG